MSVSENYEVYLEAILCELENLAPRSNVKKHEVVKGDAVLTLKDYLADNPHTIIALAYFDFDLYQPTSQCLNLIFDHLTKGSVLVFDQISFNKFPGEAIAFKEVLGSRNYRLQRDPLVPYNGFVVIE